MLQFCTSSTRYIPDLSNDREIQDLTFHNKKSQIRLIGTMISVRGRERERVYSALDIRLSQSFQENKNYCFTITTDCIQFW